MTTDLQSQLDALDLAVASACELFGRELLEDVAGTARDIRRRIGFLGETVVVALAGGTGSGKSSLLNALAGEGVAEVGVVRPTTQRPLAWIPARPEPGLTRLLDDLAIDDRVGHGRAEPLAVIDLPDLDSYDQDNLAVVRRLIPRIDMVAWVFDPLKYNDRSIHTGFLRRLADYQSQFLFVLNQADRLRPSDRDAVVDDMMRSLHLDGIERPEILVTAAAPDWGDPAGIGDFEAALLAKVRNKRTVIDKLRTDILAAAEELERVTGVRAAASLDFRNRWAWARSQAAANLADRVVDERARRDFERLGEARAVQIGASPVARLLSRIRGGVIGRSLGMRPEDIALPTPTELVAGGGWLQAVEPVTGFVTDLSVDMGGRLGAVIRDRYTPEEVDTTLRDAVIAGQAAAGELPQPEQRAWWRWAGYIQTGLTATAALSILAAVAGFAGVEQGSWPVPLLVAAGAVIAGLVLSGGLRASGRAAGRRVAEQYRQSVTAQLDRSIERRLGDDLARYLRRRAELAAALATVRLEVALTR